MKKPSLVVSWEPGWFGGGWEHHGVALRLGKVVGHLWVRWRSAQSGSGTLGFEWLVKRTRSPLADELGSGMSRTLTGAKKAAVKHAREVL